MEATPFIELINRISLQHTRQLSNLEILCLGIRALSVFLAVFQIVGESNSNHLLGATIVHPSVIVYCSLVQLS